MRSLNRLFPLLLLLSSAAFADLSLTTTLSNGQNLNLETGATTQSGGDMSFQGTSITFVGNATDYVLGRNLGAGGFALIVQATLSAAGPIFSKTPVTGADLAVGTVFGVFDNSSHYAKLLITAVSSTSLTVQFTTYGATGGVPAGGPVISRVQNIE